LGIKVRQPLSELTIKDNQLKGEKKLLDLVQEEINVKRIVFDKKIKKEIKLDIKITPKLREEGQLRDIVRHIQQMRKKAGLTPKHKISISYLGSKDLEQVLTKNKKSILETTKAKHLKKSKELKGTFETTKEIKVDNKKLWLAIKKI